MSSSVPSSVKHFDTIVIGAGISGLACASRIFQERASKQGSVAVLEARDRIGGRINSVYVNGSRLDTGANWIHGIGTEDEPNPLMKILPNKRYRSLDVVVAFRPPDEIDATSSRPNGRNTLDNEWIPVARRNQPLRQPNLIEEDLVIPSESATVLVGSMWATIGELHEISEETPATKAKHTTMLTLVKESETFHEAFQALPEKFHRALGGTPQFMEEIEGAPLVPQSAEHSLDNPGMGMLEYAIEDFDGAQVFLQDGYIEIIDELAKDLMKAGAIELGAEVEQITWDTNPITIKSSKGLYSAQNVICTIPLGVLKNRHQRSTSSNARELALFQPELPQHKREAISSLGFGTLDKIFLVFSKPWWAEEPYASILKKGISVGPFPPEVTEEDINELHEPDSFMGFTNELPGIQIHQDGTVSTGPRLLSLMNLHSLCGFPALSAFVSCANAVHVEKLSDAEAGDLVHRSLTIWLGREPPRPDAVHVTRWAGDPYSLGSYSHMVSGLSETAHRETFQQPLINRHGAALRFAGEHTSRNHFATAHGALLSGWREADAILKDTEH